MGHQKHLKSMIKKVGLFIYLLFIGCTSESQLFEKVSVQKSKVNFTNTLNSEDQLTLLDYLYYYNGGGVAVGDINNDGLPDIYFSGNQTENKLYLNQGNLEFKDITSNANVGGGSSWNTGTVMADVNGDGWLDIYVCAVVGLKGFYGYNELYINNQDNTFTESAKDYGLDIESFSSSAAFLDYDLDGDLDLYLLNHAVHTQNSFGHADLRYERNPDTGDRLLENRNGQFIDVSEQAGIYGGINGYGLGITTADFNQDGYPDIFVGNDFHEDDYLYLNQGDGTFKESLKEWAGHTSRFSMGSDAADINHDGYPDLISLDMLPEDEKVLKESEGDDNIQTQKLRVNRYGYHYQFTRNMLFVNLPGGQFMETALMSGVAATDWSWSALFADYNQDGEQDLFVANGIPKRPNNLDFIKFVSNEQIKQKIDNTKLVDQEALNMMPSGEVQNILFKGGEGVIFEDKSTQWLPKERLSSGATAYGDLDNDGDLDLVINNLNAPASIYKNATDNAANYLKIALNYSGKNPMGIGSKVITYHKQGQLQYKSLYLTKGFQASSEPLLHFGFGDTKQVDSIKVIWPNQQYQVLKNIPTNQKITIKLKDSKPYIPIVSPTEQKTLFTQVEGLMDPPFNHIEDNYLDFTREKLIPYRVSDRGPGYAIGDFNGDEKEDLIIGGAKFSSSQLYLQKNNKLIRTSEDIFTSDKVKEITTIAAADFDNDGSDEVFFGAGGADFSGRSPALKDALWKQNKNGFEKVSIPAYFQNAAVIKPYDIDQDGDLDVFVGNHMVTGQFGAQPKHYLLINEKGNFTLTQPKEFATMGMVTAAAWEDINADGRKELWVVGEWTSPKAFSFSKSGKVIPLSLGLNNLNGLWQSIAFYDIDQDGDRDVLLGNWGKNSKFKASSKYPMKLYFSDLDNNGQTDPLVAIEKQGVYYPIHGLDELSGQLVSLRKKFTTYGSFAGKTMEEIFTKEKLAEAEILEVNELQSGYLLNEEGNYRFIPFTPLLQQSPLTDFLVHDFDGDGKTEALIGGNYFGVKPYHGRFDSFPGALLLDQKNCILGNELGLNFQQKSIRNLDVIKLGEVTYLLAIMNNDYSQLYEITTESK